VPKRLSPDQIEALALATCGFEAEGDEFEIVVGGCALKVGEMVRQRHGESYAWYLRNVLSAAARRRAIRCVARRQSARRSLPPLHFGNRTHALAGVHRHRLDVALHACERHVGRVTRYAAGNLLTLLWALA
jgi:hypothetical protein